MTTKEIKKIQWGQHRNYILDELNKYDRRLDVLFWRMQIYEIFDKKPHAKITQEVVKLAKSRNECTQDLENARAKIKTLELEIEREAQTSTKNEKIALIVAGIVGVVITLCIKYL